MVFFEKSQQASLQTALHPEKVKLIQQSDVVGGGARQGPPGRKQAASSENCAGRSDGPIPTLLCPDPSSDVRARWGKPASAWVFPTGSRLIWPGYISHVKMQSYTLDLPILRRLFVLWRMKRGRQPQDVYSRVIAIHHTLFMREDDMTKTLHVFVFLF